MPLDAAFSLITLPRFFFRAAAAIRAMALYTPLRRAMLPIRCFDGALLLRHMPPFTLPQR